MSETFDKYRDFIRKELQKQVDHIPPSLSTYLCYHFGWKDIDGKPVCYPAGKMVRPLFCLLSCEAFSGKILQALPAACSIELIHNFSLIHDDIEDVSLERHHRPTLWKAFGLAPAINAGDVMFTLGYQALINPISTKSIPGEYIMEALRILTQACLNLCEGQNLDLLLEKRLEVDIEEYFYMIQRKTAALFQASTHLGAFLGGATEVNAGYFKDFGLKLGMAFQVQDDILGIWGERERTGKPVSDDILDKKKSLPVVFSLKEEKDRGLKTLREIYGSEKIHPEQVPQIMEILDRYRAQEFCVSKVNSFYKESLASLRATGLGSPLREKLENLSKLCLGRD